MIKILPCSIGRGTGSFDLLGVGASSAMFFFIYEDVDKGTKEPSLLILNHFDSIRVEELHSFSTLR